MTKIGLAVGIVLAAQHTNNFGGPDMYSLNFAAVESELISEINAGSDFNILLAATNNAADITFSGVGHGFDPGDPTLSVTVVPEPSAAIFLGMTALACIGWRRLRCGCLSGNTTTIRSI